MKNILKFLAILICFYGNVNAQQMVQKTSDMYKLEEYRSQFVDRPLKDLLKEIKPQIKTANVFNEEVYSILIFRFTTLEQQRKREGELVDRVTLLVYVKESIVWNWAEKPKGNEIVWTADDIQKYNDLTISDIGVVPYTD